MENEKENTENNKIKKAVLCILIFSTLAAHREEPNSLSYNEL
jgi:hypothetical protein